jgi:excinuclease ABC subunit C
MKLIFISDSNKTKERQKLQDILRQTNLKAKDFLNSSLSSESHLNQTLFSLKQIFRLQKLPLVINAFDNSHFSGKNAIGAMVCWKKGVFEKINYRMYNFREAKQGDDYSMMLEMLTRRLTDIKKNNHLVDLFLIDGGKIQKSAILKAEELSNFQIPFICIAKGPQRNAMNETFFTRDSDFIKLEKNSKEIFLLQSIRDEVHRFAITINRRKSLFKKPD